MERLVGVTYQISSRYDIYDAVLRKLWSKMAEKDWRTTIKALYILHRFSADGAPEHAPALKVSILSFSVLDLLGHYASDFQSLTVALIFSQHSYDVLSKGTTT